MKKAVAIFFLLFFMISQTGHYVIFYLQRWHIKNMVSKEIYAGIADRFLDVIEDNSNIEWEEKGKEFSLNGEFFDVVKIKKRNNKTFLYCLNDKHEEQLLKNFARTVQSTHDSEKGKNSKHSFKFQVIDKYIIIYVLALPFTNTVVHTYFNYEAALVSYCIEIIIPPPWNVVS